jgi:hypothetical protein
VPRGLTTLALSVALGSLASHAAAQDARRARCVEVHATAQRQRAAGQLRAAQRSLGECSAAACPRMIAADCTQWLVEVDPLVPSVVVAATGADGADVSQVRVLVDGEVVTDRLDGTAIPVDPGERRFRFEHGGARPVEQTLVIREGERARRVEVGFPVAASSSSSTGHAGATPRPRATAPSPGAEAGPGVLPWVVGGAGVLALGVAGVFVWRGFDQKADLDDRACKPSCPEQDVDAGQRDLLVADITGAVGVVAIGAAVVLLVVGRGARAEPKTSARVGARGTSLVLSF